MNQKVLSLDYIVKAREQFNRAANQVVVTQFRGKSGMFGRALPAQTSPSSHQQRKSYQDHPIDSSDQQLLQLTARGDENAFTELYCRYNFLIFNYLLRLIDREPEAEELLQEVFLAVWKGAGRFRNQANVKTWIYRIAHNQAVSLLRRRKAVVFFEDLESIDETALEPEQHAISSWRNDQILQALAKLSLKHRAVVELAFVHHMPYAEIAEVLHCPVGTVKSRMSYALRAMSSSLRDSGVDQE